MSGNLQSNGELARQDGGDEQLSTSPFVSGESFFVLF